MNVSLSYQNQMSNPIINFDITEAQTQLAAYALEAATGQNPHTNTFTPEDVARAIILIRGGAFLEFYDDVPDFSSDEDYDRYVINYMDGVAELDRLVGPLVIRDQRKRTLEQHEVIRTIVSDRMVTTETITITD